MRKKCRILIWVIIALLAGAAGRYLFSVDFWIASLLAGLALTINGLIAE